MRHREIGVQVDGGLGFRLRFGHLTILPQQAAQFVVSLPIFWRQFYRLTVVLNGSGPLIQHRQRKAAAKPALCILGIKPQRLVERLHCCLIITRCCMRFTQFKPTRRKAWMDGHRLAEQIDCPGKLALLPGETAQLEVSHMILRNERAHLLPLLTGSVKIARVREKIRKIFQ